MTLAGPRAAACLALLASVGACRRPRPLEDPGEASYHQAVLLFAKLSGETQDLSYRDPRFDQVLTLLGGVALESELRPKADALGVRIRSARAEAEARDRASEESRLRAEAGPGFQAETR